MRKYTSMLLWPVAAGVIVALVMLSLFPEGINPRLKTVEVYVAPPAGQSNGGPVSYADAVRRAAPAVVNIYTRREVDEDSANPLLQDPYFREFFGDQPAPNEHSQASLGSGVIISPQGYLLTNNHVIADADIILVALRDGRETAAEVIGTDPETDIAVLRINLPDLPVITLGTSEQLQIGDVVLAIGNPFGVGQTVTQGIVSATGRNRLGINTYENFIQTDAAINPGNSGGALIDAHGNMIGLNTAIFSRSGGSQGIGFAIPSDLARNITDNILANGRVVRGWLGIEAQEMTPVLAESFGLKEKRGLIIAGIFRNSPAHQAGLQPGDILLEIDDIPVENSRTAMNQIARTMPGETMAMTILRNGETRSIDVLIGDRPRQRPQG
ncbi:Do family serine endopeptidase [Motiliproteus sediminis]|uniref:Do family serine endopeptidase n=1 Tax=Motiliproteus sediminis TaxID=1468178 RepID=UPI001AEFA4FA|nr:Do family serine endopeptidase [Motiliproteus sediminis]